ncbi:MAG: hypothetical protein G01um101433_497 [Parcubacteria group bacterium Gr01-1014_33]|nr:MAG: hypothetical protein G01um101433_497 [Parcubacteria group bacterium Gr01-1014_33]
MRRLIVWKFCTRQVWGFTLVELLVTISIISVLASVVLTSVNSARVKARDTRRLADVNQHGPDSVATESGTRDKIGTNQIWQNVIKTMAHIGLPFLHFDVSYTVWR